MRAFKGSKYFVVGFAAAAMILACDPETAEQDTTNTFVTIISLETSTGGDELLSDVCILNEDTGGCSVSNDPGTVILTARPKNLIPNIGTTQYNDVVFDRYRVTYQRADGRNVQGVEVPYPFDGVMNLYVGIGDEGTGAFTLVRHAAKVEPPLINLKGAGGSSILSTIARVDFYGRDLAGRAISVTGYITVTFADFPDD